MEPLTINRTDLFRWKSRYELYHYFLDHYGIDRHVVDCEIHAVMAGFRPRKGRVIHTQELWQKVGLTLEKKYGPIYSKTPIEGDLGITDGEMISEDPNATRRMPAITDEQK